MLRDECSTKAAGSSVAIGGRHVNSNSLLHSYLRARSARLLPILLLVAIPVTVCQAQANFAGTEANVVTLPDASIGGFAVDPGGNLFLCNNSDYALDEADFTGIGTSYALHPGYLGICAQSGPNSFNPIAVDAAESVYYGNGTQVLKRTRFPGTYSTPTIVADGLNSPTGIVLDPAGNVYVVDGGDGHVLKVSPSGGSYGTPMVVFTWSGVTSVAIDAQGSVYAAGGYGASSGFVVKAAWNGTGYAAPEAIATGLNDVTGLATDQAGDVFVSSDDNYENPLAGEAYFPAAIVDLWEIPMISAGTYGTPIPMGGGDFYVAQGAASDPSGKIYVVWIGGPRGSFSYNIEKIDPRNLVPFGSVKTNASSQQQVNFWITGTEMTPPTITTSTQGATAADFTTTGGTNCVPDAGIPFNIDGFPVACSATVTFAPQGYGTRTGTALLISGDSGKAIASANLTGTGLPTYDTNIQVLLSQPTITYPAGITVTIQVFDNVSYTAPVGTVHLILDGTTLPTPLTLSGSGHGYAAAYYYLQGLSAGPHQLSASYSGAPNGLNPPGTSGVTPLQVLPGPVQLALSCPGTSLPPGASLPCDVYTAPIQAGIGTAITYSYDNQAPISVPLNNGAADFSIPHPAVGPHTVVVSYAAQGNYAAASPVQKSFTVASH